MAVRFYVPGAEREGDVVDLPDDEAQHLTRVLRLKAGSPVGVFNGRGREFRAVVAHAGRSSARVTLGVECLPAAPEPRVALTLAQAVLKGDKMDAVVRDAVMMGAAAVQPMVTTRSEVTLASIQRGRRRQRWERIAVSSAKQSGRATVPAILEPRSFDEVPAAVTALVLPGPALMFVEPSAAEGTTALADVAVDHPQEATVLIGPEGGWTREEVERGAAACRLVTLGGRTLRADAMAVVALAALFALWKEY